MAFDVSLEALRDLDEIYVYIAEDSIDAAVRVENELLALFEMLAANPGIGHRRTDLTPRPLLFFPIYRYLVVYDPSHSPIRIVRVLSAYRDAARVLR